MVLRSQDAKDTLHSKELTKSLSETEEDVSVMIPILSIPKLCRKELMLIKKETNELIMPYLNQLLLTLFYFLIFSEV